LRKKTNYTDKEIEQFQDEMDIAFQDWVFVFGRSVITNYCHFLHSGYILEYMKKHRCMYHHSQQGYESMKGLVTSVFSNVHTMVDSVLQPDPVFFHWIGCCTGESFGRLLQDEGYLAQKIKSMVQPSDGRGGGATGVGCGCG
jgi:hypothetical protein